MVCITQVCDFFDLLMYFSSWLSFNLFLTLNRMHNLEWCWWLDHHVKCDKVRYYMEDKEPHTPTLMHVWSPTLVAFVFHTLNIPLNASLSASLSLPLCLAIRRLDPEKACKRHPLSYCYPPATWADPQSLIKAECRPDLRPLLPKLHPSLQPPPSPSVPPPVLSEEIVGRPMQWAISVASGPNDMWEY